MLRNVCFVAVVLLTLVCGVSESQTTTPAKDAQLNVLVVWGGHSFDEKPFRDMFKDTEAVRFTLSDKGDSGGFLDAPDPWPYDVLVLYNMAGSLTAERRARFLALADQGVGLVVLHHAIANYPDWPEYPEIIGAKYFLEPMNWKGKDYARSEYTHDLEVKVHVEDGNHPVSQGLSDFTTTDEVYRKWVFLPGSRLLLTTDNPESNRELAWVREYRKSRVCFIQLGHGPQAFVDANYQRLLSQAIQWTAGN